MYHNSAAPVKLPWKQWIGRSALSAYAKSIPKIGSRKDGRIGSRKHPRKIPKGVIYAGSCGFKDTRRGTPFAAQTATANATQTVVDQGMQRAEVIIKGPDLGRHHSYIHCQMNLMASFPFVLFKIRDFEFELYHDIGNQAKIISILPKPIFPAESF